MISQKLAEMQQNWPKCNTLSRAVTRDLAKIGRDATKLAEMQHPLITCCDVTSRYLDEMQQNWTRCNKHCERSNKPYFLGFYAIIMRKYAEMRQLCKIMRFWIIYAISCDKIINMRFNAESPKTCGIACTAFKSCPWCITISFVFYQKWNGMFS